MLVMWDNRPCMRNMRSEINYCLGNKPLVVSLTNLADWQGGKRGEGDSIWLEARNRELCCKKIMNWLTGYSLTRRFGSSSDFKYNQSWLFTPRTLRESRIW